jgi:hypothetical protein
MTTRTEARDALIGAFRTAWLADGTTSPIPLHFADVRQDTSAQADAQTNPPPYMRVTAAHLVGESETQGPIGGRRFRNVLGFTGNLFTAPGDGGALADLVGEIAVKILRQLRDPAGVWNLGDAQAVEVGIGSNGLTQTNVTGTFAYEGRA